MPDGNGNGINGIPPLPQTHNPAIEKRLAGHHLTKRGREAIMVAWLAAYAQTGVIAQACRVAGIERSMITYWREHDIHNFSTRFGQADQQANDAIREEIDRRGRVGVDEIVVYKGQPSGIWVDDEGRTVTVYTAGAHFVPLTIRKYSDLLLIFEAKKRMPEYRDKLAITGDPDKPIEVRYIITRLLPGEVPEVEGTIFE